MISSPSSWVVLVSIAVLLFCYMRMLRVLYVNGKLDWPAFSMMRSASLLPLGVMVAAMALAWFVLAWAGSAVVMLPWALGGIAILGSVWACERGLRAVKRHRGSKLFVTSEKSDTR